MPSNVLALTIGALIVAVLPLPYGYYTLLRILVCAVCGASAVLEWKRTGEVSGWALALGCLAILFNPIVPIYLSKSLWIVLDVATAGVLLAYRKFQVRSLS